MSQTESFRASREALVLRLRDQEKLTFRQIGDRFDRSAFRAAQIYQAARHKIQFPPNGLSKRLNHLLAKAGFTVEKNAIANALRAGKLYPHCYPPTYGVYAHRELCEWAGVDPATVPMKRPLGYGKMTHAELCRWIGVTPHLFRNRKKMPSQ